MTLVFRLVVLVAVSLAPLAVVETYNASRLEAERDTEIRRDVSRTVTAFREEEGQLIEAAQAVLGTAAAEAQSAVTDPASCARLVARMAGQPAWTRVSFVGGDGVVRCSPDRTLVGVNLSGHREVAEALRSGGFAIGDFQGGPLAGPASLPLAQGWRPGTAFGTASGAPPGAPFGAVVLSVDLARLGQSVSSDPLPGDAVFVAADRTGRIVAAFPRGAARVGEMLPPSLLRLAGEPAPGAARAGWTDGGDRIVGYAPAGTLPLRNVFIAVGVSRPAALASLHAASRRADTLFVLTLAAAAGLAWWFGIAFVRRPIRALTAAAERLRAGDRSARARIGGRTELAALGHAFDRMADAIAAGERRADEGARLLATVIEAAPDPVFVKDREGRIIVANAAWETLVGPAAGTSPAGPGDAPDGFAGRIEAARHRVIRERQAQAFAVEHAGPEGMRSYHVVHVPVLAPDGSVTHVAGMARDITDLRAATEAARAAQERAEEADRTKTRFLAAASHDLRQPLQGALLFAEMAARRAADVPPAAAAIARVLQALDDLKAMTDGLMDISRLDAGVTEPQISGFPLMPLLERVVAASAAAAAERGLRLAAESCGATVRSDPVLLGRMLNNLVANAVRYTEQGSVVIACVPTCVPGRDRLRIEVRDTGPGIAPDDLGRIWEEFHQLHHNPGRDRRQGLGLGLAIVQRLGRLLGHAVTVSSEPGQGTTFAVEVPVTAGEAVAAPWPAPGAHGTDAPATVMGRRGRIVLVVDDDPEILAGLGGLLAASGFGVVTAAGRAEAVSQVARGQVPDLLVVDYRLGDGETGADVVACVRAAAGRNVPGVILTGEIGPEPGLAASRLGLGLMHKPVPVHALVEALEASATEEDGSSLSLSHT